jgi:hypothetical protein
LKLIRRHLGLASLGFSSGATTVGACSFIGTTTALVAFKITSFLAEPELSCLEIKFLADDEWCNFFLWMVGCKFEDDFANFGFAGADAAFVGSSLKLTALYV